MNLQETSVQGIQTPFLSGFSKSKAEEYWQSRKDNTKQELENLKNEITEPKQKENLVLSPEAIAVIAENGRDRFNEFKTYPNGWYGGKGREISKRSVFTFEQFVKFLPELKRTNPSLFLSLEGNLSLGWEDKNGLSIEIEFYPDKMEYFVESLNEESEVKLLNLFGLVEKIRKLLK
jgi:hypothetical protein